MKNIPKLEKYPWSGFSGECGEFYCAKKNPINYSKNVSVIQFVCEYAVGCKYTVALKSYDTIVSVYDREEKILYEIRNFSRSTNRQQDLFRNWLEDNLTKGFKTVVIREFTKDDKYFCSNPKRFLYI